MGDRRNGRAVLKFEDYECSQFFDPNVLTLTSLRSEKRRAS